jgi:hypothetical protein
MTTRVDRSIAIVGRPAAPQHRPQPGLQLLGRERLDHVVVGAEVEHPHHLVLVVPRGRHDHRHRADAADHPEHLGAVDVGQTEVEHDDVR